MGREHNRRRKHIFLLLASVTFLYFAVFGCTHISKSLQGRDIISEAMEDMIDGRYKSAMEKNQKIADGFSSNLADEAVFQMALLYALPGNPEQNYEKSLELTNDIIENAQDGLLRQKAKLWLLFIREAIEKDKSIEVLSNKSKSFEVAVKQKKAEISAMRNMIRKQKGDIDQLMNQIEQFKNVDLGIEEKKQGILHHNEKP